VIRNHLYAQICAIFVTALFSFVMLALIVARYVGHDEFNLNLFQKTTALAELLLPEPDAGQDEYQQSVSEIADKLDFEITVYAADKKLIAASHTPQALLNNVSYDEGLWLPSSGETVWSSQIPDGRIVAIKLKRLAVPTDEQSFAIFLILLAATIAAIIYPFVRHLTGRLERLKIGVEHIGKGDLGARVEIEGKDEVAALARSFNASAERIEQLVNSQRQLLANTSHELRTPLARIRLGIEMLESRDGKTRRAAIERDIKELDGLIDELLMMSRLQSRLNQSKFETIDLLGLVAEECARFENCTVEGEPVSVKGDARMLRHLIRNLVDNAIKHGAPPVAVTVLAKDRHPTLTISDGGNGIPKEDIDKVFEPFYRAGTSSQSKGYGLGLALVNQIAKMHGASVKFTREPMFGIVVVF